MIPTLGLAAAQVTLSGGAALFGVLWTCECLLALRGPSKRPVQPSDLDVAILVPAHNEQALVASTVRSLLTAARHANARVFVVADNCTDETANEARLAGATVLERHDTAARGKSHALDFGLSHLRGLPSLPAAVIVVDADTQVSENFVEALGERLAAGSAVVQAHYAAADGATPVARLRRLAFTLVHWSRPLGASRLRLPTTLKGNGMAFRWDVIEGGFPGGGITEDAEATLTLARRGIVADFEPRAAVRGLMAANYADAAIQDRRWEGGRLAMLPRAVGGTISLATQGRLTAAAAAFELASPPLTVLSGGATAGLALALVGAGSRALGMLGFLSVGAYVVIGLVAARPSAGDVAALAHAPRFVLHKLVTYGQLLRRRQTSWERTAR